jgi:predicted secreted protein
VGKLHTCWGWEALVETVVWWVVFLLIVKIGVKGRTETDNKSRDNN